LTTVDVPSTDLVINQTAFYLALIISISSIVAIAVQAFRAIGKRIGRAREDYESRSNARHEATKEYLDTQLDVIRQDIVDLKERSDYVYHKILDGFFNEKGKNTQ
jgi:hypothetical protein